MTFDQLHAKYHRLVRATIKRFITDPADADDVFQTVLIHLWQAHERGLLAADRDLTNYIITMSRNDVIRHWRDSRARTQVITHSIDAMMPGEISQRYSETVADEVETTLPAPTARRLEEAIARLSPILREAVRLRYYESLTLREISDRTGVTHQQVSNRLAAAEQSIKRYFTLLSCKKSA